MRDVYVKDRAGREVGADRVVLVDGLLDAVSAHDLRRTVTSLYAEGHRQVHLDLSGVASADEDGVAGLAHCSEMAVAAGRVLTWSRCSAPLVAVLAALAYSDRRTA